MTILGSTQDARRSHKNSVRVDGKETRPPERTSGEVEGLLQRQGGSATLAALAAARPPTRFENGAFGWFWLEIATYSRRALSTPQRSSPTPVLTGEDAPRRLYAVTDVEPAALSTTNAGE